MELSNRNIDDDHNKPVNPTRSTIGETDIAAAVDANDPKPAIGPNHFDPSLLQTEFKKDQCCVYSSCTKPRRQIFNKNIVALAEC